MQNQKGRNDAVRFWGSKRAEDGRQGVKTWWSPEKGDSIKRVETRKIVLQRRGADQKSPTRKISGKPNALVADFVSQPVARTRRFKNSSICQGGEGP
ncbi:hypothetical protein GEV33_003748 [Tenebrio molitor]|uniref:Uncharacterized protein n=1 Tax=Tenebrio molitor TaxID=7067 RepID=A0A8J6HRQ9_TENMO|nr:hypothetical protein GEV33_003748 [Tenebrio molitor]